MPMQRDRHVAIWLRMLAIKEVRFARAAFAKLQRQAKATSNAFKAQGLAAAESAIEEYTNDLMRIMVANYSVIIRDFSNYISEQLTGKKADFQNIVQGFIARQAVKQVTFINKTTREKLRATVLDGQERGLGVDSIAENIVDNLGGDIAKARALTIARTETHTAAGFGMQEQAKQVDFELTKTWVAVEDERTRQSHSDVDGATVGLDDDFQVGGDWLNYPGDPAGSPEETINCRCTLIYQPKGSIFEEV